MRATLWFKAIINTDQGGVYCGMSTASEVFLIFTTQQFCYFHALKLQKRVLLLQYSKPPILPSLHF